MRYKKKALTSLTRADGGSAEADAGAGGRGAMGPAPPVDVDGAVARPAPPVDVDGAVARPAPPVDVDGAVARPAPPVDVDGAVARPAPPMDVDGAVARPAPPVDVDGAVARPAPPVDVDGAVAAPVELRSGRRGGRPSHRRRDGLRCPSRLKRAPIRQPGCDTSTCLTKIRSERDSSNVADHQLTTDVSSIVHYPKQCYQLNMLHSLKKVHQW